LTLATDASVVFDKNCRLCQRLSSFLDNVKKTHPDYHARPVAPFGDPKAALLIVGLAPGMHGANRTGRPFTGDYAGVLLYKTLFEQGLANQPGGEDPNDGLRLIGCRVSNAVKCLPPENKPTLDEVKHCNRFLKAELHAEERPRVILALGQIAHQAVLMSFSLKVKAYPFGHGTSYLLPSGQYLVSSYHCSRYNTQTRRLTPDMFKAVVAQAQALLPQ
jgi:uracil-DNA glycosylase family 4